MRKNKNGNRRGMVCTPPNLKGSENGMWKGGVIVRKDGYHMVRIGIISKKSKGARYKLLHRIVMEKHLGRPLLRHEIVHHKNENKGDNRIKNLEVLTQSKHAKIHIRKDVKTGRIISPKNIQRMPKLTKATPTDNGKAQAPKPAPAKASANPKNAETRKNLDTTFGSPRKGLK